MRMISAPKAAIHRVAPAPASCPVKSQMRIWDRASDFTARPYAAPLGNP